MKDQQMTDLGWWMVGVAIGLAIVAIYAVSMIPLEKVEQEEKLVVKEIDWKALAQMGLLPDEGEDFPKTKGDKFTGIIMIKEGEQYAIMQSIFGRTYPVRLPNE